MPIGLSRGPRFGSGAENGCFRRPKDLMGKAASAIALVMAPGWGDRANLWRKVTSPGTGANATKERRSYRSAAEFRAPPTVRPVTRQRCRSSGLRQKFAPSCGDAHERLPRHGMRYPMFGAILILRLAWDLIATGRALPWHTLGIAALGLLIALLISQSAMLRLCDACAAVRCVTGCLLGFG